MIVVKLLLAPALVVASSLSGRRWGPGVAGILVALPIVAGPILLITYLDHGPGFAAAAAGSSLLGLVSLALFGVVFSWLARRVRWAPALLLSWAACLAADVGLALVAVPAPVGLAVALVAVLAATRALPPAGPSTTPPAWPWWDLPGRAVCMAALVLVVTGAAAALGPSLTGVLAPFPIATSVVLAFVLAQNGPGAVVATVTGLLRGLIGFAAFSFVLAVLVEPLGAATAFGLATATAVIVALASTAARRARRRLADSDRAY